MARRRRCVLCGRLVDDMAAHQEREHADVVAIVDRVLARQEREGAR